MAEKILTVSIAAYNVEKYLAGALESCAGPSVLEDLEVLIVNDGSTDGTSAIAHGFEQRYPGTFRVIDKENGGYGSTVNTSMPEAKGKYFRLLDGDDWFDSEGLERLVAFLKTCEADAVMTGRIEVNSRGERKRTDNPWTLRYAKDLDGQTRKTEELEPFIYGMWEVTYRTEMLREHPFTLPEHVLYTDRMFVVYPLAWIRTYGFLNTDVYCYRVGHEGQSVSIENRMRHEKEIIDGFVQLEAYYRGAVAAGIPEINDRFLKARLSQYYNNVIRTILLMPASKAELDKIREMERGMQSRSEELYRYCGAHNRFLHFCRMLTYHLYWIRKTRKTGNWA